MHELQLQPLVKRALEEDWGHGDWPTDICVAADATLSASIVAQEPLRVAGIELVAAVFKAVDPTLNVKLQVSNGTEVQTGTVLAQLSGQARALLKGERVVLNFLARLCGIATLTARYVASISEHKAQLLDSHVTTPGLRMLEQSAVASGGAGNHRLGLSDSVVIKENHLCASGSIKAAVSLLQESLPPTVRVGVEVTKLEQVQEALAADADLIVLNNLSCAEIALAVRTVQGKALLEAAGNIPLSAVEKIAATGVDFIASDTVIRAARWSDIRLGASPA